MVDVILIPAMIIEEKNLVNLNSSIVAEGFTTKAPRAQSYIKNLLKGIYD